MRGGLAVLPGVVRVAAGVGIGGADEVDCDRGCAVSLGVVEDPRLPPDRSLDRNRLAVAKKAFWSLLD